jgi:hypothetical protein
MKDGKPKNAMGRPPDLDALDARAMEDPSNEAYHLVFSGNDCRLGVVAMVSPEGETVHSIELLVCMFSGHTELRLPPMERALQLARELKDRGYQLLHEDDGWLSCGRTLPRNEVAAECGALLDIIMAFRADRHRIEKGTGRG